MLDVAEVVEVELSAGEGEPIEAAGAGRVDSVSFFTALMTFRGRC